MNKREGFHLVRDVSKYLKNTEKDELFSPCKCFSIRVCLSPWPAGVCECMLLVYTTQYEGEGRKCRLPGETGKSKFDWEHKDEKIRCLILLLYTH